MYLAVVFCVIPAIKKIHTLEYKKALQTAKICCSVMVETQQKCDCTNMGAKRKNYLIEPLKMFVSRLNGKVLFMCVRVLSSKYFAYVLSSSNFYEIHNSLEAAAFLCSQFFSEKFFIEIYRLTQFFNNLNHQKNTRPKISGSSEKLLLSILLSVCNASTSLFKFFQ